MPVIGCISSQAPKKPQISQWMTGTYLPLPHPTHQQ
jgi:hypothetical protein